MSFRAKESSSESWIAFHCHVLMSLTVAQLLSLSLTSVAVILLKIIDQLLCTVSLDLHLFHVSLLSGSSCTFCQEYHRDDAVFSSPAIEWHWVSFFHFDHWDEMMSAMLLHCKVILFPFVTNNCCGSILWDYVSFPFVIKLSAKPFINLYLTYLRFSFSLTDCNNPLPFLFILMIQLS